MTKAEILAFIQVRLPKILESIEESRLAGHLIYAESAFLAVDGLEAFVAKYNTTPIEFFYHYTNSPYFKVVKKVERAEIADEPALLYQIEKGTNLVDALNDILNHSTTVIDCAHAINIAWVLCIKELLIACYGERDGTEKLNQLLNPSDYPFHLCVFDIYALTGSFGPLAYSTSIPMLSFLMDGVHDTAETHYAHANDDPKLEIGSRIAIFNNTQYIVKHPIGNGCAMNLMYLGADQYWGFGLGRRAITEVKVEESLREIFDDEPLQTKKTWLALFAEEKSKELQSENYSVIQNLKVGYNQTCSVKFNFERLVQLTTNFGSVIGDQVLFIYDYTYKQLFHFRNKYFSNANMNHPAHIGLLEESIGTLKILMVLDSPTPMIEHKKNLTLLSVKLARVLVANHRHKDSLSHYQFAIECAAQAVGQEGMVVPLTAELEKMQSQVIDEEVKINKPILSSIASQQFSYSEKHGFYWTLTKTSEQAQEIKEKLEKSGFDASAGKIRETKGMNYRITVNPKR